MGFSFLQLTTTTIVVAVLAWCWYNGCHRSLPPITDGFFHPTYRPVADLFRKFVEDGTERGGSFSVYHQGERLLDLWGGYADPDSHRPWREDTLTLVWSATKGVTAITIAKLIEKGLLDYKKEVRHYWPEFAQNGKSGITVEMLISHQAGLITLGNKTIELMDYKNDWSKVDNILASASPDFPPGTKVGYHGFTFAMYLDALLRRVDPKHRNLSQFFQEEIAAPYDIDFYIGLPRALFHRTARQHLNPPWMLLSYLFDSVHRPFLWELISSDSLMIRSNVIKTLNEHIEVVNDPLTLEVGLGSVFGFGPASSLAKLYDFLANGGTINNKTLLPLHLVKTLTTSLTGSLPQALPALKANFSAGLMISQNTQGTKIVGHPGFGGQQGNADLENKLGIAYVTNFHHVKLITPPDHYLELEKVFYECYKQHKRDTQPGKENVHKRDTQPGKENVHKRDTQPGKENVHKRDTQPGKENVHKRDTQPGKENVHKPS